ncbi:GNAT family N-acetyltransferase [Pseudorhodoferax soli]|uniref:Ribosomal protein S18 acetylase RimI-like enzyme n=1 Tax=Pseudorhodoferax soli TaxID=545864 RepID=A0A368XQ00_9BURK|nr:GNAT family N-acetyltransferase [Pseudorhodoferax soli]RCW68587.1 ribosomal protein S18 acetylase RimI-like enzyme [Pseudorhodoferax soli]
MHAPTFRFATPSDVDRCHEIEFRAYEGDEAASREKIAKRIAEYPEGFLLMQFGDEVVGFINSGCANEVVLADNSFKELKGHDPQAPHVVIMSVAIDPLRQGAGFSIPLMDAFVKAMRERGKRSIHLMCKERYVDLYCRLGFSYAKLSASDLAGITWHEMRMDL